MAAAPPRSRAPPYPRPISPIDPDEIPVCPGTIIYGTHSDEVDGEAAKRAAKRRKRIRDHAEAYLRDEPVFIMTASLKGPFGKGWKNPWKKRRTTAAPDTREVPETTAQGKHRRPVRQTAVPETTVPKRRADDRTDLVAVVDDIEFTQPPVIQQQAVTNVFEKTYEIPDPNCNHLTPTSARRIEDWLRTNDAYKTDRLPDIRSSPTPAQRGNGLSTPDTSARRPVSAGGNNHNTQVGARADRFSSKQDLEQMHSEDLPEPSTQQTHESQNRAETAIMAQKIRSVHRIPPSTNLPAFEYKRAKREPQNLAKLAAKEVNHSPGYTEHTEGASKSTAKAQPVAHISPRKAAAGKPALSTETSKATTINHLPSAQVVSVIAIPDGLSNVQNTDDLLQPVKAPTEHTTQGPDQASEGIQRVLFKDSASRSEVCPKTTDQPAGDEVKADTNKQMNHTPIRNNLDTQALLGSIKPFDISTIKKIDFRPMGADTPITASKGPSKKKTTVRNIKSKKTSFANDPSSNESQSSIKQGFQVRKTTRNIATSSKEAVDKQPDDDDAADGDVDPPTCQPQPNNMIKAIDVAYSSTSFPAVNKPKAPAGAPRKSILKPHSQPAHARPALTSSIPAGTTQTAPGFSNPANTNGTYQSTTGSPKPDAQPRPADELDMFAIENGTAGGIGGGDGDAEKGAGQGGDGLELERFDLDAVIEDLGSFLGGSWDVERAAMQAG